MVVTRALLPPPPHPHPLCSLPIPTKTRAFAFHQVDPFLGFKLERQHKRKSKKHVAHVSLHDDPLVSYTLQQNPYHLVLLAESAGYSLASYYTSLGLFVISVPGLWSLIKRSVKSKVILMLIFFLFLFEKCSTLWPHFIFHVFRSIFCNFN